MKCKECNKEAWVVGRHRNLVEWRLLNKGDRYGRRNYNGGWKKDTEKVISKQYLRCNGCGYRFNPDDYKGIAEIKIDSKGIIVVSDGLEKWL